MCLLRIRVQMRIAKYIHNGYKVSLSQLFYSYVRLVSNSVQLRWFTWRRRRSWCEGAQCWRLRWTHSRRFWMLPYCSRAKIFSRFLRPSWSVWCPGLLLLLVLVSQQLLRAGAPAAGGRGGSRRSAQASPGRAGGGRAARSRLLRPPIAPRTRARRRHPPAAPGRARLALPPAGSRATSRGTQRAPPQPCALLHRIRKSS